jgi:hypothetical protein
MNLEMREGFNLIYAKKQGVPKNIFFEKRREVVEFLIDNIENIDLLIINEVIIDRIKLINDNKILSRYLKIRKINNII